ncbi:MAG: glycosyltransferase family 4 protein [Nanoarchaeota archaeon]|nr:glycosyltransferase family 4 protein [Nanoarchaeota archaeon]MCG2718655.1 glycosyltransferase family 4 protein [Nanoarchaeota archaeon]
MRIVHVAIRFPPATGGGEQVVYNLAKQQVKMGNEVYVVTTDLMKEVPREVDRSLPKKETMDGINVIRMKTYPTLLPVWGYGSVFFGLKKIINEIKPDIVHTHSYGYFHSDVLARLRRESGWKLVMTSHGFMPGRGIFKPIKEIYTKLIGRRTVKSLDVAFAVSKRDKKIFEDLGAENVYVVPNGVDLEKFKNLPSRDIFREKYSIKGKVILNVSRLEYDKGLDMLITAVSNLMPKFPDLTLVIVGPDYGEEKKLRTLVKHLELEKQVIFTGEIKDLPTLLSIYAAADVFVLSTLDEPFGIVLLEAMACDIPIVATNRGGVPEAIGECGVLIEPNTESIYEGLITILRNKNKAQMFVEKGKKWRERFDWKNVVSEVLTHYAKLLQN